MDHYRGWKILYSNKDLYRAEKDDNCLFAPSRVAIERLVDQQIEVSSANKANKWSVEATLFDDASVKKKLEVMSAWDAMFDDARNVGTDQFVDQVEMGLTLGKRYRITVEEIKC